MIKLLDAREKILRMVIGRGIPTGDAKTVYVRPGIHGKMGPYNIQSDSSQIFHDIMPIGNEHTEGDIQGILSARSGKESKEGGHIVRDFQQFGKVCNHLCKWGR